jgi:peroxiredoxin
LVQLQKDLKKIEASGTQIVAISYDPVPALKQFADKEKITYPLLSDPMSKSIKAFGILNQEAKGFTRGIPHPGTFLVDEKGVIRAKLFKEGYRQRHTTEQLLEAAKSLE